MKLRRDSLPGKSPGIGDCGSRQSAAQGRIVADTQLNPSDDTNASRLDLVNLDIVNRGRIEATGSGGLFISDATVDNAGGSIAADTQLAN